MVDGAGVVEAVNANVSEFKAGDHVIEVAAGHTSLK
tara:strand:- start:10490 stop:10597 length:108 start_codon:yes stop_codon:yes gene_type:complete